MQAPEAENRFRNDVNTMIFFEIVSTATRGAVKRGTEELGKSLIIEPKGEFEGGETVVEERVCGPGEDSGTESGIVFEERVVHGRD